MYTFFEEILKLFLVGTQLGIDSGFQKFGDGHVTNLGNSMELTEDDWGLGKDADAGSHLLTKI